MSKRASAWNAKFHPGLHEGVNIRRNVRLTVDLLRTKISWMHRLPNFVTHGAPVRALRARESSAIKTASKQVWLWFAEPRGGDTQALPRIFRFCWIPKKSALNQATQKKYLPKFPTPKNPGIENFCYPRHLRSGVSSLPFGQGLVKISLLLRQKYSI